MKKPFFISKLCTNITPDIEELSEYFKTQENPEKIMPLFWEGLAETISEFMTAEKVRVADRAVRTYVQRKAREPMRGKVPLSPEQKERVRAYNKEYSSRPGYREKANAYARAQRAKNNTARSLSEAESGVSD